MYDSGLVSIIVPCYNGEKYIGRFFDSLLCQDYMHIQLILVNDGSTDNSEKSIFMYKEQLSNCGIDFCYILKENGGIGSAIYEGLKHVRGEYLVWFNIDDILIPYTISKMKTFLDNNKQYAIVRPDCYISDESDPFNVLYCINDYNPDKAKPDLFENAITEHNFTFGCSMIRMELFDKINPTRYIYQSREGQNWQLLLPMFYFYESGYIDEPLYYVVAQKESTSRVSDPQKRIIQLIEYQRIIINSLYFLEKNEKEHYIELTQNRYAYKLFYCAEFVDYKVMKDAYKYLRKKKLITPVEREKYRSSQRQYWKKKNKGIFVILQIAYIPLSVFRRVKGWLTVVSSE